MGIAKFILSIIKSIFKVATHEPPVRQLPFKTGTTLIYIIGNVTYKKNFTTQYKAKHYYNWLKDEDNNNLLRLVSVDDFMYQGQLTNLMGVES